MSNLPFILHDLPPETEVLRLKVRAFLDDHLAGMTGEKHAHSWSGFDADFSAELGRRGWIGMTWPKEYGGGGQSALMRYVVQEELLAAGAPVSAHWIADRQSGPLLLRYGTEEQKHCHLPAIAAGKRFFCIGMSEPDSGSDLASIRTQARPRGDGWVLNGRKVWTSHAHYAHYVIALVRTSPRNDNDRHQGLSQFIVDLTSPGITIRPIRDITDVDHFNEVTFEDVALPGTSLIGTEGQGWNQVGAELALERSGAERFLSSFQAVLALAQGLEQSNDPVIRRHLGRIMAHLHTLRRMSLAVASMLQGGTNPMLQASVVKCLGADLEQELPSLAQALLDIEPDGGGPTEADRVLAYLTLASPAFSLRGGTREILRSVVARGLGL